MDCTAEGLSDVRKWVFLRSFPLFTSENAKEGMSVALILTQAVVNHVPEAATLTLLLSVCLTIEYCV